MRFRSPSCWVGGICRRRRDSGICRTGGEDHLLSIRLRSIGPQDDLAALIDDLAPAFGGDRGPAHEILEQTIDLLTRDARPDPWGCYLAEYDGLIVGTCAFKAAPAAIGTVEIAYMTFPAYENRGHATAMAAALVEIAAAAGVPRALAHTLPEESASTRVLRRSGFAFVGEVEDAEDGPVWRWEKVLT